MAAIASPRPTPPPSTARAANGCLAPVGGARAPRRARNTAEPLTVAERRLVWRPEGSAASLPPLIAVGSALTRCEGLGSTQPKPAAEAERGRGRFPAAS